MRIPIIGWWPAWKLFGTAKDDASDEVEHRVVALEPDWRDQSP